MRVGDDLSIPLEWLVIHLHAYLFVLFVVLEAVLTRAEQYYCLPICMYQLS